MSSTTLQRKFTDRRSRSAQRGLSTIEFAMLFPVFMATVLATFDIGRGYFHSQSLLHAAQEGTREGVLPDATTASVTAAVNAVLAPAGIEGATIQQVKTGSGGAAGDTVKVTVSYSFVPIVTNLIPAWGSSFTLTQTVRGRHE